MGIIPQITSTNEGLWLPHEHSMGLGDSREEHQADCNGSARSPLGRGSEPHDGDHWSGRAGSHQAARVPKSTHMNIPHSLYPFLLK